MRSDFQYMRQVTYLDSVSIDNVGNCIVQANDDFDNRYFLFIRTVLGVSRILQIGPINTVTTECVETFLQIDYDERRIHKIIDSFLNGNKDITQVQVLSPDSVDAFREVTKQLPDMRNFLYD